MPLDLIRLLLFATIAAYLGCARPDAENAPAPPPQAAVSDASDTHTAPPVPPTHAATDTTFAALIERLSGPAGYFDTDNLISNESSYLHVVDGLESLGLEGGVYIGVGPDQNFSYIAHLRPAWAFIVDIRRDNLLQHLFFKALFARAHNRAAYLSLLFGRPAPDNPHLWLERDIEAHIAYIDDTPATPASMDAARALVRETVLSFGVPLSEDDLDTITYIHTRFISAGLDLRFNSHNRAPQPYYPTFRRLLLETDRAGRRVNYLVREQDYRVVRELSRNDRIVPLTGNLGGRKALPALAAFLESQGEQVTAFYTSNVEFYLMGDGLFDTFCANVRALPRHADAVMIRSYFNRYRGYHPLTLDGHGSTQLLQSMSRFAEACPNYASYRSLLSDYIQ